MIRKLSHVNVFALDQDRALDFHTEKLGFELRTDVSMDGMRWLTVGPKDQPDRRRPPRGRRARARRVRSSR